MDGHSKTLTTNNLRMATYQTNAIVLKREDIFEADRVYNLYTEEFGKVRAIAGSVRKINAKLSGHLEPFNIVWVELATKKNGDLFITTALSFKKLLNQNFSPAQVALFAKMADFACLMLKGPQKDEILWSYILESFSKAGLIEADTDKFLGTYKTGFIKIMGFGDNLEEALWYNY